MPKSARPPFYELRNMLLRQLDAGMERIRRDRSLLDVRSGLGETLLHWMAVENQLSVVQALSEAGSAIDSTNHFGSTPLQEAALLGYTELCEFLLSRGADPAHRNGNNESILATVTHLKRHTRLITALLDALPADTPLRSLLEPEQIVMLNFRNDAVARLFRERGLPVITDPLSGYGVDDRAFDR